MKVAIIGGGASGVLAALRLKFNNPDILVTIYEKNNKLLKKVSVTGAGRCNLGNQYISPEKYTNEDIISSLLELGYKDTVLDFFHDLGLFTTVDDAGRIYPMSNQAQTVVELLTKNLFYKKVNVVLDCEVSKIERLEDKFIVCGEVYDKVIVCVGSNAGIKDEVNLLKELPLKHKEFTPGLVGFKVKENISFLMGVRAGATVSLSNHTSKGEVMFKEDGISGICVMDLSVFYDSDDTITIDFLDEYPYEVLKRIVARKLKMDPYVHLHNLLFGSVHNKILGFFNKKYPNSKVTTLPAEVLDEYLKQFKEFKLTIKSTYGLEAAQVGKGGISLNELNMFEAKKIPGLFVCGEATDNVGICGGFNLWYAFTSGVYVADKLCK